MNCVSIDDIGWSIPDQNTTDLQRIIDEDLTKLLNYSWREK